MPRILVVDDDLGTVETFSVILRLGGFEVDTAACGLEGLNRARERRSDLLLSDLRLPDFSGIELLRSLRTEGIDVPAIIMTAFGTIPSALEAARLGAVDYLEKPLFDEAIIAAVRKALRSHPASSLAGDCVDVPSGGAAAKWAELVLCVVHADKDPRSLDDWGALAHVCRATVWNRCAAAGVDAKASLDFARMVRAIAQAEKLHCNVEALLEMDPRTLRRLSSAGGLASTAAPGAVPALQEFLEAQQFVTDRLLIKALLRILP